MISDQLAEEMLANIEDKDTRERYARILGAKVTQRVRCTGCGQVIAFIDPASGSPGGVVDTGLTVTEPGKIPATGLAGHRIRLDGTVGFQCWCGADERLLPEEKGMIGAAPPSAETLTTIAGRIKARQKMQKSAFVYESVG